LCLPIDYMPPRAEDWTSATVAIQRSLFREEPQAETGAFVFVSGMSEQDNIAHYAAPGAVQPSALSLPPAQYTIQAGKSMANNGSLRIAENGLDSSSAC
ncbi:hypothetical protein GGI19_006560, partial [Coemansia pectinata]